VTLSEGDAGGLSRRRPLGTHVAGSQDLICMGGDTITTTGADNRTRQPMK
jgi:hypothetical protein